MEKLEHLAGKIFSTNKRVFIPFIDFNRSSDEFDVVEYYIQRKIYNDKGVELLEEEILINSDDTTEELQTKLENYIEKYGI